MTVITKKQLNRVTELLRKMEADNDMSKYSRAEREMFITLISMLGLHVTKIDGITSVVPEPQGASLWHVCRRSIDYDMSTMKERLVMHDNELADMMAGTKPMNEDRKKLLMFAKDNIRETIAYYKKFYREVEED